MKSKKLTGATIALAAASMFAMAPIAFSGDMMKSDVKCYDVNGCKGKNDCKSADNACKGKASCKGHGFVKMSKEACEKVGGKEKHAKM